MKKKQAAPAAVKSKRAPLTEHEDSYSNLLTGLGTGLDKRQARRIAPIDLLRGQQELDDLYCGDDMIARIVDLIPKEMCREWIDFKADGDPEMVKKVAAWMEDLQIPQRLQTALIYARLYGGSVCILGVDDGQPSNMPLDQKKIKGFYWLTTLDRFSIRPDLPYSDPFSPRYGTPSFYFLQSQLGTSQGEPTRFNDCVHSSRLLRFDGITTTPRRQQQNQTWADSVLLRVLDVVADFQATWASVGYLMTDMSQAVFTIKNLAKQLAANQRKAIEQRFALIEMSRSVARAILLDDGETFERKATPLEGVPLILDRFANRVAAAVDIPVMILMGESPKGLNATGDADTRHWYDRIHAEQEKLLRPAINRILTLALNAPNGPTGGKEPENWSFEFRPLTQLDGLQEATRRFTIAQADNIYLQAGVVTPEEVADSRFSGDGYNIETTLDEDLREKLNDGSAMGMMTKALMKSSVAGPDTRSSETGANRKDPQRMSQPGGTDIEDSAEREDFDPNQPRASNGEFGEGGGSGEGKKSEGEGAHNAGAKANVPSSEISKHAEHFGKAEDFIDENPKATSKDFHKANGQGAIDTKFKKNFYEEGSPEANSVGKILKGTATPVEVAAAEKKFGKGFEDYVHSQYAFTQAKLGDEKTLQLYRGVTKGGIVDFSLTSYTADKGVAKEFSKGRAAKAVAGKVVSVGVSSRDIFMHHAYEPHSVKGEVEETLIRGDAARKQAQLQAQSNKTKIAPVGGTIGDPDANGGMASGRVNEQEQKGAMDFSGKEQPVTGSDYSSNEDEPASMDFTGMEQPATGGNEKGIALVPSETVPDAIEQAQARQPGGEGPIAVKKKRPKGSAGSDQSGK